MQRTYSSHMLEAREVTARLRRQGTPSGHHQLRPFCFTKSEDGQGKSRRVQRCSYGAFSMVENPTRPLLFFYKKKGSPHTYTSPCSVYPPLPPSCPSYSPALPRAHVCTSVLEDRFLKADADCPETDGEQTTVFLELVWR